MTTNKSSAVTKVNIFKCKGLSKPKINAIFSLKNNNTDKNRMVDPNNVIKDVETILPFSFSLEKNLKKAVSKPKDKKAIKYAAKTKYHVLSAYLSDSRVEV